MNEQNKLSSIQLSIEFKKVLKEEKNNSESYEAYIKRLRSNSIDKNKSLVEPIYRSPVNESIEEKNIIKINPYPLPKQTQEQFKHAEKLERDPFTNAERVPPTHEIKQISFQG